MGIVKTIKYMSLFSKSWTEYRFIIFISNDHSSEIDVYFGQYWNRAISFEEEGFNVDDKKLLIIDVTKLIKRVVEI